MTARSYGQACPIARSLDLLGDRWTLLVVRELLLGPKRFRDLGGALPGIGPNRLSDRLSLLVEHGIVEQQSGGRSSYELTPLGEGLRAPILAFGLWGLGLAGAMAPAAVPMRADLIALCLSSTPTPPGVVEDGVHAFAVGDERFWIELRGTELVVRSGDPQSADTDVSLDFATFIALVDGALSPTAAVAEGRVALVQGNEARWSDMIRQLHARRSELAITIQYV